MAITASPIAENDRPLNANSVGLALTAYDTLITATGGSGTFLPGETIVQTTSGARGSFLYAQGNNIFVSVIGSVAFTTTAGHTLTGLRSGATRGAPSAVTAVLASPNVAGTAGPNLLSGLTVEEFGFGPIRLTQFRMNNMPVQGFSSTNSYGSQPIYAFPQGYIQTLGGFGRLTVTGATGTAATATLLYSVGSAPVVQATAAGGAESTISNIFNQVSQTMANSTVTFNFLSGAVAQLTDSSGGSTASTPDTIAAISGAYSQTEVNGAVARLARKINNLRNNVVSGALLDGTTTPALANLNFTNSGTTAFTANTTLSFSGTLNLLWVNYGNLNNNA